MGLQIILIENARQRLTLGRMFDLERYLVERSALVDAALERRMPLAVTRPARLHEAMRYSLFAGGKRLRPVLCLAAAEAVGGDAACAMLPAMALEALHTYTLIHDDLPAMDDDALRRGRPTNHNVFGEAVAILAGDALLTLAFEWMGNAALDAGPAGARLVVELAQAAGSLGVIGGQVEDMAAEGGARDPEQLRYIHEHKTAALIRASVRIGALAVGAAAQHLEALTEYGQALGLAFQIADDVLNATSTPEQLGKAVGSDQARGKLTYVALYGIGEARTRAAALAEESIKALAGLPGDTTPLAALARFAVQRAK